MHSSPHILNVGHVTDSIDRAAAGVAVAVSGLCSHLADLPEIRVSLVATTGGGATCALPASVNAAFCRIKRIPPLPLRLAPGFSGRLARTFASPPVEIVHCHGLWRSAARTACAFARRHELPLVVSTHGMLTPWALQHKAWKKRMAWRLYQGRDIRGAALLHATSEQEAEGLRKLGLCLPIAVIPNGLDIPPWREPENGRAPFRAMFLGRIHPVKGLVNLVDAWAQLRPAGWQCVLAGPDEAGHRAELEALIRRHGLQDAFSFAGPMDDSQKWDLYRRADLFILPSFTENFGLVVAEALACGVPAIATHGTPWRDLAENQCGWHVALGAAPLAEALGDATALSHERRREMGLRGRRLVEDRFGWPLVARRMHDAYLWVLNRGTKPDCII